MLDILLEILIASLAAHAVLSAWLKGSIFSTWRSELEAWRDFLSADNANSLSGPDQEVAVTGPGRELSRHRRWHLWFWSELLTCRFCLNYHVSFWIAVAIHGFDRNLPVVWLAAVALSDILSRLLEKL